MTRAVLTLAAATVAGALVWLSTQFALDTNPGFWAAMGVLAGGGALLGLVQLGRGDGDPAAMAVFALLPVALAVGWVLVAAQPEANELGTRVADWSGELGIGGLVESLGTLAGVLAFGAGVVFGLTLAEAFAWQRAEETRATDGRDRYSTGAALYADDPEARAEAAEREAARIRRAAEQRETVRS
jgi:hypothetical protein